MKRYVVGIVFDNQMEECLMLLTNHGPYPGKLNGVGGKIEDGEEPDIAMAREFKEETGIPIESVDKIHFLVKEEFPLHIDTQPKPVVDLSTTNLCVFGDESWYQNNVKNKYDVYTKDMFINRSDEPTDYSYLHFFIKTMTKELEDGFMFPDGTLLTGEQIVNMMEKLKTQSKPRVELNVYYIKLQEGIDSNSWPPVTPVDEGHLIWIKANSLVDASYELLAGEGNVAYFINAALVAEGKKHVLR